MNQDIIRELSGSTLAYLGDAVLEVLVRRTLLTLGTGDGGALSRLALRFVKASAQSAGIEKILPILTEDELYIFKRGRNAHGISIPKSATAQEYRRATGMEALFGYLDLTGQPERADELFRLAYADVLEQLSANPLEAVRNDSAPQSGT